MAAIEFENVSFGYGETPALDGVSLTIGEGEHVCVVGGNGSGKSTLARHMNALLVPASGTVKVFGNPTDDPTAVLDVRRDVGMVFQNPDDQIVASIVEDEVAFGPENLGIPPAEIRERVTDALGLVGLGGCERRDVSTLSGGQKQRLAIAGALAMRPRVLVLDEASSMLDPRGRADLMGICRELNEAGLAIVQITHFADEMAQACRLIVLDRGRVVADGPVRELLAGRETLDGLPVEPPLAARMGRLLEKRGIPCAGHLSLEALASDLRVLGPGAPCAPGPGAPCAPDPSEADGADGIDGAGGIDGALGDVSGASGRTALVAFESVSFEYENARQAKAKGSRRTRGSDAGSRADAVALEDVSFDLFEGEILGVAGHTGSGKSTLVQLCNGLLMPTEGRVLVDGRAIDGKRAASEARKQVGVVFQYPEHQLFAATVREDVAFGPRNQGLSAGEVDARVRYALESVHLDPADLGDRSPFSLSGGQQRRVAFAGVLAMQPSTLVFDEPTAGLDARGRDELLTLLRELNAQGLTIALVSHDMDALAELCDRVLVLNKGRIHAIGSPANVFSDADALGSIGLAQPETMRLASLLGIPRPPQIPTPEQLAEIICAPYGT